MVVTQWGLQPKLKFCTKWRLLVGVICLAVLAYVLLYVPEVLQKVFLQQLVDPNENSVQIIRNDGGENFYSAPMIFQGNIDESRLAPIIFMETSTKSILTLREACVIESAAYHNQDKNITVFSISKLNVTSSHMSTLFRISNINAESLNLDALFKGTPLDRWYKMKLIQHSRYPVHHLSDATRLAILWKHGGVYLDTDSLVLRPLKDLRNSVGLEHFEAVGSAILIFDRFSPFLYYCMMGFASDYHQNEWGHQGPALITRTLKLFCGTQDFKSVVDRPELCHGVHLLPARAFFHVPWTQWELFFTEANLTKSEISDSYIVHLFSKLSSTKQARPNSGVLLEFLVRRHCPQTFQWMLLNNVI